MKAGAAAIAVVVGGAAWLVAVDARPGADADWALVAPARVELAPGVAETFEVDVVPGDGRTVSRDGPLRLDLAPADGVTVSRRRLSLADAVDPGAAAPRFAIKLAAERAGAYPLGLSVRFWLCARQSCKPVRSAITIAVDVTAPAVPDAAPAPAPAVPDAAPRRRAAPRPKR